MTLLRVQNEVGLCKSLDRVLHMLGMRSKISRKDNDVIHKRAYKRHVLEDNMHDSLKFRGNRLQTEWATTEHILLSPVSKSGNMTVRLCNLKPMKSTGQIERSEDFSSTQVMENLLDGRNRITIILQITIDMSGV